MCDNSCSVDLLYFTMKFNKSILFVLTSLFFSSLQASVTTYFNQIKKDPNALYAFFKLMPKGGELHYHLAGGPYPETMLSLAASGPYCLDKTNYIIKKNAATCNGVQSQDITSEPDLYSEIIKSWSMKDFVPGKESGHDHFFNSFDKFRVLVFDYRPQLIIDVIKRAAQQHEHYLEIMEVTDNANSINFGNLIKNISSYSQKKELLLGNKDFQNNIAKTISESDRVLEQAHKELGCTTNPNSDVCQVKIKFLYFVLREQPLDNVFAQTLNAFEAVSQSKGNLVGVNLVQPEDGIISLRDYHKQMLIFNYFHKLYPQVKISLHAGELAPEAVTPEELSYHIRDAIFTGQAERIGHGVDIYYENNAENTLKHMAEHQIAVEINLISNQHILNISGRKHPLNDYLSHHVPVVLSTDDEGILRTDLTRQYVEAVLGHGLNYPVIKQINRNALTYSFLPGKSIWSSAETSVLVNECQILTSPSCKEFIKQNEKAKLQWDLEQKLNEFENKF